MLLIYFLFLSIPLRWIHLQPTRITRLFSRDKFCFNGQMRLLYAYAVNEFAL